MYRTPVTIKDFSCIYRTPITINDFYCCDNQGWIGWTLVTMKDFYYTMLELSRDSLTRYKDITNLGDF